MKKENVIVKQSCHSRELLSGIYNVCRYYKKEQAFFNKCVEDPRLQPSGMTPNLMGFTLIELLVVVLIIGILVAVAVPQYQRAVEKSKYQELISLAMQAKKAQEVYYLSSSEYATHWNTLDVSFPGSAVGKTLTTEKGIALSLQELENHAYVRASQEDFHNAYVVFLDHSANMSGNVYCEALETDPRAKQICISLGGIEQAKGMHAHYGAYLLSGSGSGNFPPITYTNEEGVSLSQGDKCVGSNKSGCKSVEATSKSVCMGTGEESCNRSSFTNSTCQGKGYNACNYSSFKDGSICMGTILDACRASTFENSSCYGNAQYACGAGAKYRDGAICYANVDGACYNSTFTGTGCCKGEYCPSNAPICPED